MILISISMIFVWEFTLNNKRYIKLNLNIRKLHGKRKVTLNGKLLVKRMIYT
jgi:hypothetical protein